jgi:hypothetical protein
MPDPTPACRRAPGLYSGRPDPSAPPSKGITGRPVGGGAEIGGFPEVPGGSVEYGGGAAKPGAGGGDPLDELGSTLPAAELGGLKADGDWAHGGGAGAARDGCGSGPRRS